MNSKNLSFKKVSEKDGKLNLNEKWGSMRHLYEEVNSTSSVGSDNSPKEPAQDIQVS
jgi:hypothetical protein